MTVIHPNSISGIASVTSHSNSLYFYESDHSTKLTINAHVNGDVTATNGTFSGDLTVGGTLSYDDVTNIDSVGVITARSDVSIADKIVHTGDTDTAIRFPGADQVSIETGGTQRLLIGSDGKLVHSTSAAETVDFGTSNSSGSYHKYDLGSSGATLGFIGAGSQIVSGSNVADFGIRSQANLVLAAGGDVERARVTSDGKFGLGTQTPGDKLSIDGGSLGIYNTGNNHGNVYFYKDGTAKGWLKYRGNDEKLVIGNVTDAINVLSSGNVGVNCTPLSQFQVKGGTNANIGLTIMGGEASIEAFNDAGSANVPLRIRGTDIKFFSSSTERLRIASDGDVFIGNSNLGTDVGSTAKLEVTGTLNNSYPQYSFPIMVNDDAAYDSSNGPGGGIGFSFKQNSGGAYAQAGGIRGIKENTTDGDYASALLFYTRPNGVGLSERLRIDSNGHLIQGNYTKLFNKNNNNLALIAVGESTPTVYVSDSGDDSTGDGTSSSPFRTLTKAWNYIPKVFTHNQTARIMIKGTSYTIDTDYYMRAGASGGNWQWGPAVEIRSESGSQIDVYLRRGWRFENVDGLKFNHLNFICDNANGYLYFNSCARGKIYNTCDMTVSVTKGWSERVTYDNCQQFVDDMDIDVTSAASSGLGGLVVVRSKSSLSGSRYITKAGSVFGNSAVSVCDDSFVSCNWDVTNFATGYAFGYNHYNAETNGIGMLNGVTITNCTTGIRLRNNSFVRKYNLTYSGNSTNEDIQSGSFVN